MRLYIIAGEASGDLHGAALVRSILVKNPDVEIRAWGGDLMKEAGADLVRHYKDLAFMGFAEVLLNLRTILKNIAWCKKDIEAYQPDGIIFIDYPGFNLRIARWSARRGFRNFYYITPQIWAWNTGRARQIKADIEQLYAILPFEKEFYSRYGMDVAFVGHPLKDLIADNSNDGRQLGAGLDAEAPIIALLPGSRKQEISKMLPVMLAAVTDFSGYRLIVAAAPAQEKSFYENIIQREANARQLPDIEIISGRTYEILRRASLAIVTSGTATLETAMFQVPQVVVYRSSWLSYLIARSVVKVPYISLVNLILDKEAVPELIQGACTPENIRREVRKLLPGHAGRERMMEDYNSLWKRLGPNGAADSVARDVLQRLTTKDKVC